MDSSFYDMIFKRKSFHRYGEPDGLKISPEELDLISVATVTPDTVFPSTACVLQSKIETLVARMLPDFR